VRRTLSILLSVVVLPSGCADRRGGISNEARGGVITVSIWHPCAAPNSAFVWKAGLHPGRDRSREAPTTTVKLDEYSDRITNRQGAWWFYSSSNEMHNTGKSGMESAEEITPTVLKLIRANADKDDPLPDWLNHDLIDRHNNCVGGHGPYDMMKTMPEGYDTDPMWTVMKEGGPAHSRGFLAKYCEFLEQTGRGWAIPELRKRHPREFVMNDARMQDDESSIRNEKAHVPHPARVGRRERIPQPPFSNHQPP